jgi:ribosome-interacting GTPase 1
VANKSDIKFDPEEITVLEELIGVRYPAVSVSARTGEGLDTMGPLLFAGLNLVRVYTKIPGKPPEQDKPYTLFRGETVQDVARLVHRDIAATLKFARIWGSGKFDGQQVGKDHLVNDGDVVELHS